MKRSHLLAGGLSRDRLGTRIHASSQSSAVPALSKLPSSDPGRRRLLMMLPGAVVAAGAALVLAPRRGLAADALRSTVPGSTARNSASQGSSASEALMATAQRPRLISVGAGVTEIVYALGAQSQLVGTDTSSLYPAAAQSLPKVGYQRTLTAEGVMSLAPQVVLASQDAGPPAVLTQVAAAGVTVVRVDGAYSFEGLLQRVGQVASATGRVDEGARLACSLSTRWAEVSRKVAAACSRNASGTPLKVAFLMRRGTTVMAAGRGTGADAMLRLAGARNVFADAFENYKPLSAEALTQAAPDMIIGTSDGPPSPGDIDALKAVPGVALTPAGRAGAIRSFDIVLLLGFGPRLPEAVETLHRALHG